MTREQDQPPQLFVTGGDGRLLTQLDDLETQFVADLTSSPSGIFCTDRHLGVAPMNRSSDASVVGDVVTATDANDASQRC